MKYVFDTSPLSQLFKNYYRSIFRGVWIRFDELVHTGRLLSTREVFREIQDGPVESLRTWAEEYKAIFATPTAAEGAFVARIYEVPHFRQNIEEKKLLKGGKVADPFVIARAAVEGATVVTIEKETPNATRIPNICQNFDIDCMDLESFMQAEGWQFG